MHLGETPKTEDETLVLKVVKPAAMPNDRELTQRMEDAARGKIKENGIMRHPHDTYRP